MGQIQYPNYSSIMPSTRMNNDNRIFVQGIAGANSFPVSPNTVVQLMDNEQPYFYLKSADINGVIQPLKRYHYEEDPIVPADQNENHSEYVTKEDFNKKFEEIMAAINNMGNRPHYNNRKGDRNESRNE